MIIMIDCENSVEVFDTSTGIKYRLFISNGQLACDVISIHTANETIGLLYTDNEAIQFWQQLKDLPGIDPGWVEHQLSRIQNQIEGTNNG